ncbi:hypothetical protein A2U01_0002737 [Trifolium medium]|uniref:Uncharacterized protein n=1 Tax=Trifolium medium TaxID=97028 RepID=A0A392M4E6_9FABA|nr:hypothetical protein [Trifolium medium]
MLPKGTTFPSASGEVNNMAGEQDAMPAVLKVNLRHTWAKMKTQSDKRRFNVHFQVGSTNSGSGPQTYLVKLQKF